MGCLCSRGGFRGECDCKSPGSKADGRSIGELVKDGENGRIFYSAAELARQLAVRRILKFAYGAKPFQGTLRGFPDAQDLQKLRSYFEADSAGRQWNTWDQQWREAVRPLLAKKEQ